MNILVKISKWVHAEIYAHITVPYRYYLFSRKLDVRNGEETMDYIIHNHVSISRYGDGEYMSINNESNNFNKANKELAARLKEVLNSNLPNLAVCLPHAFRSLKNDNRKARIFWKYYIAEKGKMILSLTPLHKVYYDASFTRFYMDAKNKNHDRIQSYVNKMKLIWDKRNLLIVEGENSRFGVGDDLLDNARSIRRILCPSTNAFIKYKDILRITIQEVHKDDLILCALGATATVLSYDLTKMGYQVLDIGHADIEYSWFKLGVDHKVAIGGKAVNEVGINTASASKDKKYIEEIVAKVV